MPVNLATPLFWRAERVAKSYRRGQKRTKNYTFKPFPARPLRTATPTSPLWQTPWGPLRVPAGAASPWPQGVPHGGREPTDGLKPCSAEGQEHMPPVLELRPMEGALVPAPLA